MNRNIKSILIAGLAASTTACSDLDVDLDSHYTQYPDNPIAVEAKMADCYRAFAGGLGRRIWEYYTLASDEALPVAFDTNWVNDGESWHPASHIYASNDAALWHQTELNSGIAKCNSVIMDIGGEDGRDPAANTARVMRAFYHFLFMDMCGDVPVNDHLFAEDEQMTRAPRAEVARFIESELLDVLANGQLTDEVSSTTYGKPNKWMAEALLVKLYLNWAVYTADKVENYSQAMTNEKLNECVRYCDDIITSGLFEVGRGYRQKFFPNNGPHIKDFIYAMEYDHVKYQGMSYSRFESMHYINKSNPTYYGFAMKKSAAGNRAVNPRIADLFNLANDERNSMILKGDMYVLDENYNPTSERAYANDGSPIHFTRDIDYDFDPMICAVSDNVQGWMKGYKSNKYPGTETSWSDYNQDNDVPIFRFADILLTKAECIARGANATLGHTPASLINEVRDCSGAESFQGNATLQDILDERGRELFYEIWRRNDLIRYDQFEDDWGVKATINPDYKNKKRRVFPIHIDLMNANTNWVNNQY
ncbi:MAG: RagB/SusD family nutrient uptake outer membrane protein [Muribaculaceae bacterium]|nr:RagB/SusD family nutrient uptake outer membrane protein [Muribaculaceae bacterium]